jgi:hypothetical protein
MTIFGCKHRQLSRLFTLRGQTYQVCLDCGAELEYDLETMQPTGAEIERASGRHPDYVSIARRQRRGAHSEINSLPRGA